METPKPGEKEFTPPLDLIKVTEKEIEGFDNFLQLLEALPEFKRISGLHQKLEYVLSFLGEKATTLPKRGMGRRKMVITERENELAKEMFDQIKVIRDKIVNIEQEADRQAAMKKIRPDDQKPSRLLDTGYPTRAEFISEAFGRYGNELNNLLNKIHAKIEENQGRLLSPKQIEAIPDFLL